MADEDESEARDPDALFPSSFLFPSVVSKITNEETCFENSCGSLSGFGSFQKSTEINNSDSTSIHDQINDDGSENQKTRYSEVRHRKKSKKEKRRNRKYLSDSSEGSESKKKKKKKKKHKYKSEKTKQNHVAKPNTIWLEEALLSTSDVFRVDTRCDKENLNYDTLYRMDIAAYNRGADISCLGLSKHQHFLWNDQRSIKRKNKNRKFKMRYFVPAAQKELNVSDDDDVDFAASRTSKDGFVSLNTVSKSNGENDDMKGGDNEHCKYIDHRKTVQECKYDARGLDFSKKTEYFNKRLRDDPSDVTGWLEYAKLQDSAFADFASKSFASTFNNNQESAKSGKAITQKKLNILEKALMKNPSSEPLIIEYMKYYREIEDSVDVRRKWVEFTFAYPNKCKLWQEYLLFLQSDLPSFDILQIIEVYMKCFKTLSGIAERSWKSHSPEKNTTEMMMKILLQYCFFLLQSDQAEKAIGSIQALIEFNCFMPDEVKSMPIAGQKEFFETFWDSAEPRFGEEKSCGWNTWMSRQNNPHHPHPHPKLDLVSVSHELPETSTESEDTIDKTLPKHKQWLEVEQRRERCYWKPTTGDDDDDDMGDMDRTVMSTDVLHCLFKLENEAQILDLLLIFLVVIGVQVRKDLFTPSTQEQLQTIGLLTYNVEILANVDPLEMVFHDRADILNPARKPLIESSKKRMLFIEAVFAQSTHLASEHGDTVMNSLSRIWFLFEIIFLHQQRTDVDEKQLKRRIKNLKKFAKSLLKLPGNRSCFALWELYANFEFDFGGREEVFRVFDMVISMCIQQADDGQSLRKFSKIFRNYSTFLIHAIEQENSEKSNLENKLINLLSLLSKDIPSSTTNISDEKINPLRLRKAKSAFREIYSIVLDEISAKTASRDSKDAFSDDKLELLLCYAIFECFTSGMSVGADFLDQWERDVVLSESQVEKITQLRITLSKHDFKMNHARLQNLKEALWNSVARFPEEPRFNRLLMELEGESFNSLKIRRFLQHGVDNAKSIYPWVFAIWYEQKRHDSMQKAYRIDNVDMSDLTSGGFEKENLLTTLPSSGITNRLRSLFQRAILTTVGSYCVPLWRSYVRFEVNCGNLVRAKNIFYQALQNCPWAKAIYLDAIVFFPEDFEDNIDMMQEKQIRIRLPVEEIDILLEDEVQPVE